MKGKGNMEQLRWYRALGLVAIAPILSLTLAAQSGDPVAALQQKLNSQFKLTVTTKNLSEIVTAGDVVVLHKDGLKMSALAAPLTESSTYKDGKIGGGGAKRAALNKAFTIILLPLSKRLRTRTLRPMYLRGIPREPGAGRPDPQACHLLFLLLSPVQSFGSRRASQ